MSPQNCAELSWLCSSSGLTSLRVPSSLFLRQYIQHLGNSFGKCNKMFFCFTQCDVSLERRPSYLKDYMLGLPKYFSINQFMVIQ